MKYKDGPVHKRTARGAVLCGAIPQQRGVWLRKAWQWWKVDCRDCRANKGKPGTSPCSPGKGRGVMSIKAITEAVELVVEDGALFTRLAADIKRAEMSQGDWMAVAMDAIHLGTDVAERLLPAAELARPLPGQAAPQMAIHLASALADSLSKSIGGKGHLTLQDVLHAVGDAVGDLHLSMVRHLPSAK